MIDASPHNTARIKAHEKLRKLMIKHNAELAEIGFAKGLSSIQSAEHAKQRLAVLTVSIEALRSMGKE